MSTAIRTAEQLSYDERSSIVRCWLSGGVAVPKMAEALGVQQDTIRLVLAEEGWT